MELLCDWGADADLGGPGGWTALHFAVRAGSMGLVRLLVERLGADILAQDDEGITALDLALLGGAGIPSQQGVATEVPAPESLAEVDNGSREEILEYLRRTHDLLPAF